MEQYRRPKGPTPTAPAHIRRGEHLRDLSGLLNAVEEAEPHVPCRASKTPSLWISPDPADILAAVAGCARCPVMDLCAEYVERWPEPTGTWGAQPPHSRGHARGSMPTPEIQRTSDGEPIVPSLKHCSSCGIVKASRHFDMSTNAADGLTTHCAECRTDREADRADRARQRRRRRAA